MPILTSLTLETDRGGAVRMSRILRDKFVFCDLRVLGERANTQQVGSGSTRAVLVKKCS